MVELVPTADLGQRAIDLVRDFCRACGSVARERAVACAECGESLVSPPIQPSASLQGIGVRTEGTRKIPAGTFPIVDDDGKKWSILLLDGTQAVLKHKNGELTPKLKKSDLLGRWLAWAGAATSEAGRREFWSRALMSAANIWDRRRLAMWALDANHAGLIGAAGLSDSETLWLRLHAAMRARRTGEALQLIEQLPRGRYPDTVELVASLMASAGPRSASGAIRGHLEALDRNHPVTLLARNDPLTAWHEVSGTQAAVFAHLRQAARFALSESTEEPGSGALATLARIERGLADAASPLPTTRLELSSTSVDLLTLWDHRAGSSFTPSLQTAGPLDERWAPYADDLLECWFALSPPSQKWLSVVIPACKGALWGSVQRRLAVLQGAGEPGSACEQGRRLYEKADWSSLRELGATGEHFLALADIRDGDVSAFTRIATSECLRPDDRSRLEALGTIADGTQTDIRVVVEDESTWGPLDAMGLSEEVVSTGPLRFREWFHLTKSKQSLFAEDFERAALLARECLRISTLEDIRDEALNLLAVALQAQGNSEAAAGALEKALEETFSDRLLVNWALARVEAAPDTASTTWLQVATRAEYPPLRANAGLLALSEADEEESLADLIPIARDTVRTAGNYDAAMAFLRVLGDHDEKWFKDEHWEGNPYWTHRAFQVRVALYHPDKDHLEVLGKLLRQAPEDQELLDIRDSVVDAALSAMGGGDDEEDVNIGVAAWGLRMLDVVPLKPRQEAILSLWSVQVALDHFGRDYSDDELPGEGLLKFITRAETLAAQAQGFDESDRLFMTRQAALLRDEFARQNVAWHAHAYDRAVDTYNGFIDSIRSVGYGYRVDKQKVRAAAQQFADSCERHINELAPMGKLISDDDLKSASQELTGAWKELQATALGLKRQV